VRRAIALAAAQGRAVHLLRWDVARLAFDRPEVLARYGEVDSVTHAVIRVAASRWARRAVSRWSAAAGPESVLVGETPLIGERFATLARPQSDEAEQLLASEKTRFLIPVPSAELRDVMERARRVDVAGSGSRRDTTSAPPHLVASYWRDLVTVARNLGLTPSSSGYDPPLYRATYLRVLRHRHASALALEEIVVDAGTQPAAAELVPTAAEVAEAIREVERAGDAERSADGWYRS
jgi:hypothetical protein